MFQSVYPSIMGRKFDALEEEFIIALNTVSVNVPKIIKEKSNSGKDAIRTLETYYYYLNYIIDKEVLNNMENGFTTLLNKILSDIGGIIKCLESGYQVQAQQILRSQIETCATLKYILKDVKGRLHLYENYKHVLRYERGCAYKKEYGLDPLLWREITKKYNRIKNDYELRKSWYYKLMKSQGIKHPTINKILSEAEKDNVYKSMYTIYSYSVHGYIILDDTFSNNNINTHIVFKTSDRNNIISMSAAFTNDAITSLMKHLKIEKYYIDFASFLVYLVMEIANVIE